MKTMMQWTTFCAGFLALVALSTLALGQTVPPLQGTSVADPAVPVLVTPAPAGSGFFVLNQDFSVLQHSTVDTSQNQSCNGPGIFSRTNPAPRTLVTDLYNAYLSGPDGSGSNTAVDALSPEISCTPVQAFDYTGGLATQSLAANDPQHALYYLVSAFNGAGSDELIVLSNLNNATVSSTNKFTELNEVSLDNNAVYTSVVSDTRSSFGLTAVTELKTSSSPGNLWIYYPQTNFVYKILGPGGTPLPAVTSFIIPAQTDGGGSLLVLVNQDGLTSANLSAPPQDLTPFTIIDLGQLRPLLDATKMRGTITLPFVTQINATTSYYAMLGGAYNPLDHRVYAVVAGGTSTSNVVENIISYDTLNPSAPAETVVADVSNVPFSLGAYPQLALNAASGTMQILTSNPASVYSVGITGTGNSAVVVPGSTFPDSNFSPTYIAANPLQGETYIASSSGQVDVMTRPASMQGGLTLTLTGPDLGYLSQDYQVTPLALWPVYDASLATTKLTITATPVGGTPVTLATGHVSDVGYPGSSFYTYTFPAAGPYTIVATADASALYPAVTSPPLHVFVGNTGVYPTAVALSVPATVPSSNGEASLNASVTLTGSTYGPNGQVYIQDQTGAEVGNVQLPSGVIANPITVPIVIGDGAQTLTAVYSGDDQNQSSKSTQQTITVGTVAKVTPTFTVTVPSTAKVGATVAGNVKFTASSTTAPTGTVMIYATLAGSTTSNQIATVTAAAAFASGGASFSFTAPAAGSYTVFAGYGGDTNYNNAVSPNVAITVGAPTQQTAVGLVAPATATAGQAFNVVVGFNVTGAYTTPPTGNIILTATTANGAAVTLGMITPAQGMAPGGGNISATLANAGTYTLNANYAGDSLYAASSNMATVTVGAAKVTPTLGLFAPDTQNAGTTANATITFISTSTTAPTGNISIYAIATGSTTQIPLTTVSAAKAVGGTVYTFIEPAAGSYMLCASYAGDTTFNSAVSNCPAITVNSSSTVVTSLTLKAPASVGAATSFNVVIALSGSTTSTTAPTGSVILTSTDGNTTRTVVTISAAQAFAKGGYTASLSFPTANQYMLNATYAGDANYSASTAGALVSVIAMQTPTTLGISAPSTVTVGTSFVVTATLKATGTQTVTPAAVTGNVTFTAQGMGATTGSYVLGTVTAAQAFVSGGAQLMVTVPAAGKYTVSVSYAGDANYAASSGAVVVTISLIPTSIKLNTDEPDVTVGTAISANVSLVQGANVTPAPTGDVVVTTTLGGVTTATTTLLAGAALAGASARSTPTSVGTYTITADYSGDTNYLSASSSVMVKVSGLPTPSLTLTGSTQGIVATPVSVTVSLTEPNSVKGIVSTGLVTVTSTINGASGPSTTFPASATNATLTFPTAGDYSLVASYAGDANYGPTTSATYDNSFHVKIYTAATLPGFTLQTQDPNLTSDGPPIHVAYTDKVTVPMLTKSVNGFIGGLDLTVTSVITNADGSTIDSTLKTEAYTLLTEIVDGKGTHLGYEQASINVGDKFGVVVEGSTFNNARNSRPFGRIGGVLACFLFGMFCLQPRMRKSTRGAMKTLAGILLIVSLGTLTPGCAVVAHKYTVTVTAVSTELGLTRTSSFQVIQDPK